MKKLPVGRSDFKDVIEGDYYYVDKSLFIKELMDNGAQALLIPRPRRFGKTLNLSMLRYFFEKTATDTSHLFRHLQIWQAGAEYRSMQGKYPVIYLTFKDIKESNWASALEKIKRLVAAEFLRHKYLRQSKALDNGERDYFEQIILQNASQSACEDSLKQLSHYLATFYEQKVILLIDEYDTPIQAGYIHGYYNEMVGFMRNFLSGGLKDNSFLEKGVLTGILRIAKESIFSGLNNLGVFTLLRSEFSTAFGLTEMEVEQALGEFQVFNEYERVRNWYNGYVFGAQIVYNPWSIINYLNSADKEFCPYWLNTSDNSIVERLLTKGGKELRQELENLIAGTSVEKAIEENIVFGEIEQRDDLLWSFLLFAGYLKYLHHHLNANTEKHYYQLAIPNREVRKVYFDLIEKWFDKRLKNEKLAAMLEALIQGEVETFEEFFAEFVEHSFSFWDAGGQDAEKVYQAFTIGLLVWLSDRYEVKSNQESGYGRYDVMLIPKNLDQAGIIIEFKKVKTRRGETKDIAIARAFEQIERKKYASVLQERSVHHIRKLAIVFQGKQVWVQELPEKEWSAI